MAERSPRVTDGLSQARQGWARERLREAASAGGSVDAFAREAPRGARLVYWEGHLSVDREIGALDWARAETIGAAAMRAYEQRQVVLVQERIGPGSCRYIAVRL